MASRYTTMRRTLGLAGTTVNAMALIAPGAFKRTLARDNDVRMYLNHNSDMVLASTRSGTLSLAEDERGLKVDAEIGRAHV